MHRPLFCTQVRVLALAILLAAVPRFASAQATSQPARDSVARATITGVVLDSLGKPVANATVRVAGGSPSTTTNGQGVFRLEGVPAGEARVQVTGDGYRPLGFEFAIAANVTVSLQLTLLPAPPEAIAPPPPPIVRQTARAAV